MPHNPLVDFKQVDRSADPAYFIRFLDTASALPSFQVYKRRIVELLELEPGHRVLDVACGTGDDSRAMAGRIGNGQVVGCDFSQAMIAEARRRGGPVEFEVADAQRLPYPDDAFDACRCDRSFMHIPDPRQALAEMRRVARPGGRIVIYEVDFGTITIDAPDRRLARIVSQAWSDGFRNGWLGRYVPAFCRELGLGSLRIEPAVLELNAALAHDVFGPATVRRAVEQGLLTSDEAQGWLAYLDAVLPAGRFFSTLTGFLVAGMK